MFVILQYVSVHLSANRGRKEGEKDGRKETVQGRRISLRERSWEGVVDTSHGFQADTRFVCL